MLNLNPFVNVKGYVTSLFRKSWNKISLHRKLRAFFSFNSSDNKCRLVPNFVSNQLNNQR